MLMFDNIPGIFYQEDEIYDKITLNFRFDENSAGTFSTRRSALSLWKEGGECYCQPWSWQRGES